METRHIRSVPNKIENDITMSFGLEKKTKKNYATLNLKVSQTFFIEQPRLIQINVVWSIQNLHIRSLLFSIINKVFMCGCVLSGQPCVNFQKLQFYLFIFVICVIY